MVQNLPNKGDKLYLMHKEVIITKIYTIFRLIKIHYTDDPLEFFVDASALTIAPDYSNSISIGLLRGSCGE